jgi:hypothetical protein
VAALRQCGKVQRISYVYISATPSIVSGFLPDLRSGISYIDSLNKLGATLRYLSSVPHPAHLGACPRGAVHTKCCSKHACIIHGYKYLALPRPKGCDPRGDSVLRSLFSTSRMLRTPPRDYLSRSPRSATMDRNYSDQLEQEISKNGKIGLLLRKARRQSRQHKDQLKDLEDTVKKNETDLQEPWAESHKLLNQLSLRGPKTTPSQHCGRRS